MFKRTRIINGKKYDFIEHSFRIGEIIRKASFYLPRGKNIKDFDIANKEAIKKLAELRVNHIKKNQKYSKFFTYGQQLQKIEERRIQFQVLSRLLNREDKDSLFNDFLRIFLVNSMAMEGGTVSYDIAKAIEEKKKIKLENINEADIPLYLQLKQAYLKLRKMQLRYPKQIKELHKVIYIGIYPFAGKFRKKKVTFGDLEGLAFTSEPEEIVEGYRKALQNFYRDKCKVYDFERVLRFHKEFQQVHGFEDGNSRLGRLVMASQLLKLGYPPFLIRGSKSKAYRRALVKAINEGENTPLLKLFYNSYQKTFDKFWLPALEEKLKGQKSELSAATKEVEELFGKK